jgi:septum formation protein
MIPAMRRIILASTSRHRAMLMDRLGLAYEVESPRTTESLPPGVPPEEGTLELARRKAKSVARDQADAIVIGSDQMAVLDGRVLDKPGTPERAVEQILLMAGRTHELWTSVCVIDARSGRETDHTEVWSMRMRTLTPEEALRYVEADAPLDCAGSYRFESLGAALFESFEGGDPTAITGLPLVALTRMLMEAGVPVPQAAL